jgi:hypothetical protein
VSFEQPAETRKLVVNAIRAKRVPVGIDSDELRA